MYGAASANIPFYPIVWFGKADGSPMDRLYDMLFIGTCISIYFHKYGMEGQYGQYRQSITLSVTLSKTWNMTGLPTSRLSVELTQCCQSKHEGT